MSLYVQDTTTKRKKCLIYKDFCVVYAAYVTYVFAAPCFLNRKSARSVLDFAHLFADADKMALFRLSMRGDPGMTRTCDPWFRKPLLYPAELRGLRAS